MERSLVPEPSGQKPREKHESHEKDPEGTLSRPALGNGENAWTAGVGRDCLKRKLFLRSACGAEEWSRCRVTA